MKIFQRELDKPYKNINFKLELDKPYIKIE